MTNLTKASKQWHSRPDDERFTSLADLDAFCQKQRMLTKCGTVSNKAITVIPEGLDGIKVQSNQTGQVIEPTNHAFNQLSTIAKAPASYLRTLPTPMIADCMNYGLQFNTAERDIGVKVQMSESGVPEMLRCATGPDYGTIWNGD